MNLCHGNDFRKSFGLQFHGYSPVIYRLRKQTYDEIGKNKSHSLSNVFFRPGFPSSGDSIVHGRYMPLQDKILFWDGHNLGLRGDYNGVLLLDTILQAPIGQNDDYIKLEIILSEAIIFQNCITELESEGLECPCDISNELTQKINQAQLKAKKGIKAQRVFSFPNTSNFSY